MIIIKAAFWFFLITIVYTFIVYPIVLLLASFIFRKSRQKSPFYPTVTLVISAYNEELHIRDKLKNTLDLKYPKEKLEIIVASDGSNDHTDDIVRDFQTSGIKLLRIEGRVGKTEIQNRAVGMASGDILIFSDAESLYDKDSLLHITSNFSDQRVGAVAGKCVYVKMNSNDKMTLATQLYWKFETQLKMWESEIGTVTGASGLIYAIRKSLYLNLPPEIISDLVTPLLVLRSGNLVVYEPKAIAYEKTSGKFKKEMQMRSRVILRGMNGLKYVSDLLNPINHPWISFQLFSHKIVRWITPISLIGIIICSMFLIFTRPYTDLLLFSLAFIVICISFFKSKKTYIIDVLMSVFASACASAISIYRFFKGTKIVVWDTDREK